MKAAEKALLMAVRDQLRLPTASNGAGYTPEQCEVEYDEMAPAVTGDLYVPVLAGGWVPGPRHNTCGGINDLVYAVRVAVVKRGSHVPRDRKRDIFLGNVGDLADEIDKIYNAIDWRYTVNDAANAIILKQTGSSEGFTEVLKFAGIDDKPTAVDASFFGGNGKESGLMRRIWFRGARRETTKS